MNKLRSLISLLSLCLVCSVDNVSVEDYYGYVRYATSDNVCDGDLSKGTGNLLPVGFYGNKIDSGVFEVGGHAGDDNGDELPSMTLGDAGRYVLVLKLDRSISRLSQAKYLEKVGYRIIAEEGSDEIVDEVTSNTIYFSNLFQNVTSTTGYYMAKERGDTYLDSFMSFSPTYNSLVISFSMKASYKLKSITVYYSDTPINISNAYLSVASGDADYAKAETEYSDVDCSLSSYTKNVGDFPVYDIISQYGKVYSKEALCSYFVAYDDYTGEWVHPTEVVDNDNYFTTGSTAEIGTEYVVYINAYDDKGNLSYVTLNITVGDLIGPTIYMYDEELVTSYDQVFNAESFIDEHFFVLDNYDEDPYIELTLDDGSEIPENKCGVYDCILYAEDSFGNETSYPFTMTLVDDVAPVIYAENNELILSNSDSISEENLLKMFTATDAIDGSISCSVYENTYSGNESEIGTYSFTVQAVDKSGNVSYKTVNIYVQDNDGPIFFAKESFITFVEGNAPSLAEVTESLIRQGVLEEKAYPVQEIIEGYGLDSSLAVGTYSMTLYVEDEQGDGETVILTVKVISEEDANITSVSLSFWDKIVLWFKNLWANIVAFFTGGN